MLKLSMVILFLGGGACPQTPLVGRHARECAFSRYYHPATILFPLPQLKILYETLRTHMQIVSDDGQLASARLFVL